MRQHRKEILSVEKIFPMAISVEELWKSPKIELLATYYDIRRRYVEQKFARDSQRARLEWLKARAFMAGSGGVSERRTAVDASEELGRKGQELREMTRDLDLLKTEVDLIDIIVRLRGASAPEDVKANEPGEGEEEEEGT